MAAPPAWAAFFRSKNMKLVRLENRDFDALADKTRLGCDAREMARAHLVAGASYSTIAVDHDVSQQRVGLAVGAIRRVFLESPPNNALVNVELIIPVVVAKRLSALLERSGVDHATSLGRLCRALDIAEGGADEQADPRANKTALKG